MKKSNVFSLLIALLAAFSLNAQQPQLMVEDKVVDVGQTFSVDVKTANFKDIESTEFAFYWNPGVIKFLSISNLNPSLPDFQLNSSFGLVHTDQGRFRFSWYWIDPESEGATLSDDATLFTINFKAVGAWGTHSLLQFDRDTTIPSSPLEVLMASGGQPLQVDVDNGKVSIGEMTASTETFTEDFTLFQNSPNPFTELTYISFNLTTGSDARLTIFDENGRVVHQQNKKFPAGMSRIPIHRDMLSSAGSYFYTLETERATATRQLIMQ